MCSEKGGAIWGQPNFAIESVAAAAAGRSLRPRLIRIRARDAAQGPLSPVGVRPSLPALLAALRDGDELVRARAAQAIGEIGSHAAIAVPELLTLLENDAESSRIGACIALRGIGPPAADAALPALERAALDDRSEEVRYTAAFTFRSIKGLPTGRVQDATL